MPLNEKDALELIKFQGLHEAEDLEAAKTKFQSTYYTESQLTEAGEKNQVIKSIVGKQLNKVKQNILKGLREEEIEFTNREFDDMAFEDFASEVDKRRAKKYTTEIEALKGKAGANNDEVVKDLQAKLDKLQNKYSETEKLKNTLAAEFDGFKSEAQKREQSIKIDYFKRDVYGKLPFDASVDDLKKKGFFSTIEEKYSWQTDDQGNPFLADKQGQRLRSKKNAAEFMTPEEILEEEGNSLNIFKKNPQGGQPAMRTVGTFTPPGQTPAAPRQVPGTPFVPQAATPRQGRILNRKATGGS